MDLEEMLDDVITELTNDIYNRIRDSDAEFDAKAKQICELSEVTKAISRKLTPEEYADFEEMIGMKQELQLRMQKECYIQGARDCVTLLKKLGVI